MPINKWVNYIKTNLFSEHEGFFELPYLSNDPQLMLQSIIDLTVSEIKLPEQAIYTNNAFIKGVMRYRQVDEGLWLLGSYLDVKKNIVGKAVYDPGKISDYYYLSFAVFEYQFPVNDSFSSFGTLVSTTCTFYRPLTPVNTYFYENTKGKFFNIVFNKSWAEKNIPFKTEAGRNDMLEILSQKTCFMSRADMVPDIPVISELLWVELEQAKNDQADPSRLRDQLHKTIGEFFNNACSTQQFKNYTGLHHSDYFKLAAAEKIILHNLALPFVGVECIAKKVNLSPTKLKMIFKSAFGFSMLQYHKEKNMLLAMQLMVRSEMQVKNIALLTGFESASKFTAAFKKRFDRLPSSYRNT